jgi:predicted transcriptional regulator of viral defense system
VLRFYGSCQQLPYNRNNMASPADHVLDLIDRHGLVRARDVKAAGIPTVYLTRLVREGAIERVARGLYARASAPVSEHVSLAEATKLAPRGVICLASALSFHGLGTQNPHRVWLALPHKAKPPTSSPVQLAVVRMHPRALAAGVVTHRIDGVRVPIFDPSKTIADLFKFRFRVGLDVALEALRAYWVSAYRDQEALRRYAHINGVEKVLQPYLEAVVAR